MPVRFRMRITTYKAYSLIIKILLLPFWICFGLIMILLNSFSGNKCISGWGVSLNITFQIIILTFYAGLLYA